VPFGDVSELDLQRIWHGVDGRVVHGERVTLGIVELEPDAVVPEHAHENEQLGLCLSGTVRFRIGDETRELRPGMTWSIPANVPHEVHTGPEGAVLIDVFSPVREDWKSLEVAERRAPRWP
jgi:quercetin dioxygenase-like cupin family protein